MLVFDAHLDISMNATEWNRDLTRPLEEIRNREALLLILEMQSDMVQAIAFVQGVGDDELWGHGP